MSNVEQKPQTSNENIRRFPSEWSEPPVQSSHTVFLSKLIGLYLILIGLPMIVQKQNTIDIMNSIMKNPALLFLTGALGMVAGVALILAHNVWSGGAVRVMVTLVGWIAALKGVSLLFLATFPQLAQTALPVLRYDQFFYVYTGFTIVLGAVFVFGGFRSR
jgi:hypothetical protein